MTKSAAQEAATEIDEAVIEINEGVINMLWWQLQIRRNKLGGHYKTGQSKTWLVVDNKFENKFETIYVLTMISTWVERSYRGNHSIPTVLRNILDSIEIGVLQNLINEQFSLRRSYLFVPSCV